MAKFDIYSHVTNEIIKALESSKNDSWVMPWQTLCNHKNLNSGKSYQGINTLILACSASINNFSSQTWATFKQWQDAKCCVKKGQEATKIVFWQKVIVSDKKDAINNDNDNDDDKKSFMFAKYYNVFSADQVDGYTPETATIKTNSINLIEHVESWLNSLPEKPTIQFGGDRAFYSPSKDYIQLPTIEQFTSGEGYCSTLFHELTHWTGHKSRCDRDLTKGKFGNSDYAYEELIAELGSAFLCSYHEVSSEVRQDHVIYIQSWLNALKNDKKFIFSASSQAQKAVNYLTCNENKE